MRTERLPPRWGAHRGQPKFRRPSQGDWGRKRRVGRTSPIINHNEYKWASNRHVLRRLGGPVRSPRLSGAAGRNQRIVACRGRAFAASQKYLLRCTIISVIMILWRFTGPIGMTSKVSIGARSATRPCSQRSLAPAGPMRTPCAPLAA